MLQLNTDWNTSCLEAEQDHVLFLKLSADLDLLEYVGNKTFEANVGLTLDVALKSDIVIEKIRNEW